MNIKEKYGTVANQKRIDKVVDALKANNIEVVVVKDGVEAKAKVLELVPTGVEIMTMTSQTLEATGIAKEINESGKYNSVRKQLTSMDRKKDGDLMQKLGAAPAWTLGSVHAVTEDGRVVIASATGSQLPAYAYGSGHVVWVVGAQKLVKNLDEAMERIYKYTFPLEDARARVAYGVGSGVNKLLVINKEATPKRITLIIVKENLGF